MMFQPVGFVMYNLYFSVKLTGIMSKVIKLSLTELVGQCSNILPLAFSALTSTLNSAFTILSAFLDGLP